MPTTPARRAHGVAIVWIVGLWVLAGCPESPQEQATEKTQAQAQPTPQQPDASALDQTVPAAPGATSTTDTPETTSNADPAEQRAVDEVPVPEDMPVPTPAPELAAEADRLVKLYTQAARERNPQSGMNQQQLALYDTIMGLWDGSFVWRKPGVPRFPYDADVFWALCFSVQEDADAAESVKQKAQALRYQLLADRAVSDGAFAVARVMLARQLLVDVKEKPTTNNPRDYPRAFMLMGDHDGLCRWMRWHLHRRGRDMVERHTNFPMCAQWLNELMVDAYLRLAQMEADPRALSGWARVALTPDASEIFGTYFGPSRYMADSYQMRWRGVWQAWAFDASEDRLRETKGRFLEVVEHGWRERVLFEINANTDRPIRLAEASDEAFTRCWKMFRGRHPRWLIRSWGKGPFDAEAAAASQRRLKDAWVSWVDTLVDDDPVADIQKYYVAQERLVEHSEDLNRQDYAEQIRQKLEANRPTGSFQFQAMLADEIERRHAEAMQRGKQWNAKDKLAYARLQDLQAARLAGDVQRVRAIERAGYALQDEPGATAQDQISQALYAADRAAEHYDTAYFIAMMDRAFSLRQQSPPRGLTGFDLRPW